MATKLGTVVTYFVKLLTIKSFDTLIMWLARSRDKNLIHKQIAYCYKLGRMVTYLD